MRLGTIVLVALMPALAVAAPRAKSKKKKTTTITKPAEQPSEPDPTPDPPAEPVKPTPAATAPATPSPSGGGAGTTPAAGAADPKEHEPEAKPTGNEPDVDSLRQEYLSLRDELFKSRARASTVASQLYSTRIQIRLTYTTARYYNPAKASIRLDGASVWENAAGAIATDDGVRFDGYVAPGRHLISFRVEAAGKDDDTFTSVTETQIAVKAVAGKDLVVAAKARDSGDIAYEWKKQQKGSYGLGIDVAVKTQPRAEGGAGDAARPPARGAKK